MPNLSVPMHQALNADGQAIVRKFFSFLLKAHSEHKTIDIGKFLKAYVKETTDKSQNSGREAIVWTYDLVERGIEARQGGKTWKCVAQELGVSPTAAQQSLRWRVEKRGRQYGEGRI